MKLLFIYVGVELLNFEFFVEGFQVLLDNPTDAGGQLSWGGCPAVFGRKGSSLWTFYCGSRLTTLISCGSPADPVLFLLLGFYYSSMLE